MSITFKLEIEGHSEALNVSNGNAAALLALAGLLSAPYGEIPYEQLEAAITKLLRAMNSDPARAKTVTSVTEGPRWSEGARTDEYLKRRVGELTRILVYAKRQRCGVTWG